MMSHLIKYFLIVLLVWSGIMLQAKELPSQQGFIKVPGDELYYQQFGIASKRQPPIVVLHGGPGMDQGYLLPQMLELAKDHEMIFYDQRGAGKSSRQLLDPHQISMERYVQDLEAVRKYFGFQKMILLGHSFGGILAAEYAIQYPDHVAGLILMNSVPMSLNGCKVFNQKCAERLQQIQESLDELKNSSAFQQGDPHVVEQWYRMVFETYCAKKSDAKKINLHFSPAAARNGPKIEKLFGENFFSKPYDLRPQLHQLSIPTLIIHGNQDPVPVKTAFETKAAIPQATMIVLDPCGHFSYLEQPKKCFEAIRKFLKNTP